MPELEDQSRTRPALRSKGLGLYDVTPVLWDWVLRPRGKETLATWSSGFCFWNKCLVHEYVWPDLWRVSSLTHSKKETMTVGGSPPLRERQWEKQWAQKLLESHNPRDMCGSNFLGKENSIYCQIWCWMLLSFVSLKTHNPISPLKKKKTEAEVAK